MSASAKKGHLFHRDLTYSYPIIVGGEGIYMFDDTGKRYIDAAAGATNVTLGHGRARIVAAMAEQAKKLAYCFSTHFTNQPALDLAQRITALAPGALNHAYFVSGGSEANETAFKIARLHHVQRGKSQKHLVISRWRGYHGATLGAMAASGLVSQRTLFSPVLPTAPHISPCYCYRCKFAGCEEGKCNLACARELEQEILHAGPDNVSAFIAEPIVQAGIAAAVPPPDYFPLIRKICDKYDVLFIADEVVNSFGRTGKYFAVEHWGVEPDIIVFAKALGSGYSPLGGLVFHDKIHRSFTESGITFPHIYTFVNNPVSARVGLEVLDIIEEENILEHVTEMGEYMLRRLKELQRHAIVGEVRGKGLLLGIELVQNRATKEPFPTSLSVDKRTREILLEKGLSVSTSTGAVDGIKGDSLQLSPPLIITRDQIDQVIRIIDEGLGELEEHLVPSSAQ